MRLAIQFALSYLAVIVLFALIVVVVFPLAIGDPEAPLPLPGLHPPPPREERAGRAAARVLVDGWKKAGRDGLLAAWRTLPSPLHGEMRLLFRDAPTESKGDAEAQAGADAVSLTLAWSGHANARTVEGSGMVVCVPLQDGAQPFAVLTLAEPPPPVGPSLQHTFVQIVMVAALVSLLVGMVLSQALSRPLQRLATAVERFGPDHLEQRVEEAGPGEVRQVAQGFNAMAERLQVSMSNLQREKERVEKLELARRDFLADVSHNLGTPLAAVLGWTDMLLEGTQMDAAERATLLVRIQRNVQYVARTVRQLLDLSRWEAAPPELRLETFPIVEPLMEVVESLSEAANENGTLLSLEDVTPACKVYADRLRVREVLQILLENVVAHAGPNVSAVVRVKEIPGRVEITILDNGLGIETGRLNKLQQRFHPSGGRGAGLGLSIAHRLVAAHGRELLIAQRVVGGTEATFSLAAANKEQVCG